MAKQQKYSIAHLVLFSNPFPTKWDQESVEKLLIPGRGQGRYKMNLEHLVMPEIKHSKK